jgi:putative AbiEii toxin of type IV toxin-antitoxin system
MFKLTFKNLGPIREAKLELRPLTVIIGDNNTGKTYLAYATYALLLEQIESLRMAIDQVAKPPGDDLRITSPRDYAADALKKLKPVVSVRPRDLTDFFQDTSRELFFESRVTGQLPIDAEAFITKAEQTLNAPGPHGIAQGMSPSSRIHAAFEVAAFKAVPRPLLLPAERNAFVLTYKMLANRRYRLLRAGARRRRSPEFVPQQAALLREQDGIQYPTPIEDFLDFLSDVELSPQPPTSAEAFQELAGLLEHEVQGGQELFFEPTKVGGRELRVRLDGKRSLDLYNASSSIKQLAPLLLYLRYRAAKGDLLVIDEPEMNLHPEGQARLLEVLAILANLGVYVLVTTHSPYILAHLNNLTASTTKLKSARLRQAEALYLRDRRAFLPPDRVSAYEAGGGTLRDLHDPAFGIRWDTLSDVSTELQQKFFAIREQEGNKGRGRAKKA